MREFFLNQNISIFNFKIFNILHLVSVVIIFGLLLFIIYKKERIASISNNNKKKIRIIFGIILLVFYILRRGSFLYYGVYNWKYHLSLGFCNMTSWLFILYCFSGNNKIYNLCYYCAFCGPLLSILFPVVNIGINNFSFINFIMIHHVILLMNVVFAIFEKKKYSKKDMIISYLYMIGYILLTYLFNFMFGTNYNELGQFISNSVKGNSIILFVTECSAISIITLLIIGIIMSIFGGYVLNTFDIKER